MSKKVIKGFVDEIRDLGGIKFIIINTNEGYNQVTINEKDAPKEVLEQVGKMTRQSCVHVHGEEKENSKAPGGKELFPDKIEIISIAETPLPLDPSGKTKAELDTRLNWRSLDLRHPRNKAIMTIQSKLVEGMTEHLAKEGFTQVFTPCILGAASEGGSEVFPVAYFDKEAFLRQDPQLHRELAILGGIDKIFDLGPSWRAELSHTSMHLCEHRTCAVEVSHIKDEYDVMKVEEELVAAALKRVVDDCGKELKLLGVELEVPKTPFPVLEFPKIYDILKGLGKEIKVGDDMDREAEMLLWEKVKKEHGSDFFFINKFPYAKKPFYVMKDGDGPWARSTDLAFRGLELSSGGQREHRYNVLIEQVKGKKLSLDSVEWFTKFFKYGAPTLGGFAIGIERLVMKLLDIKNIREVTLFARDPDRLLP